MGFVRITCRAFLTGFMLNLLLLTPVGASDVSENNIYELSVNERKKQAAVQKIVHVIYGSDGERQGDSKVRQYLNERAVKELKGLSKDLHETGICPLAQHISDSGLQQLLAMYFEWPEECRKLQLLYFVHLRRGLPDASLDKKGGEQVQTEYDRFSKDYARLMEILLHHLLRVGDKEAMQLLDSLMKFSNARLTILPVIVENYIPKRYITYEEVLSERIYDRYKWKYYYVSYGSYFDSTYTDCKISISHLAAFLDLLSLEPDLEQYCRDRRQYPYTRPEGLPFFFARLGLNQDLSINLTQYIARCIRAMPQELQPVLYDLWKQADARGPLGVIAGSDAFKGDSLALSLLPEVDQENTDQFVTALKQAFEGYRSSWVVWTYGLTFAVKLNSYYERAKDPYVLDCCWSGPNCEVCKIMSLENLFDIF